MYEHDYYLNSLCLEGEWLHDYQIRKEYETVVVEVCTHCHNRQQFKKNGSNRRYMSYHIKQALQPYQKRFFTEYPHLKQ